MSENWLRCFVFWFSFDTTCSRKGAPSKADARLGKNFGRMAANQLCEKDKHKKRPATDRVGCMLLRPTDQKPAKIVWAAFFAGNQKETYHLRAPLKNMTHHVFMCWIVKLLGRAGHPGHSLRGSALSFVDKKSGRAVLSTWLLDKELLPILQTQQLTARRLMPDKL